MQDVAVTASSDDRELGEVLVGHLQALAGVKVVPGQDRGGLAVLPLSSLYLQL